jgi:predicted enzyme related to lactoylglutathione lyase
MNKIKRWISISTSQHCLQVLHHASKITMEKTQMPTIVHFDIPVDSINRAKSFYEKLFDWKIERVPGDMTYYLIETTDLDGSASVGGGMAEREQAGQQITNFIGVSSIDDYLKEVETLGGKVLEPKTPIIGWGYLAVCLDTENNTFGLWEDDTSA